MVALRTAVVANGVVETVILAGIDFTLSGKTMIPIDNGSPVASGWSYDGAFSPPVPSMSAARNAMLDALADLRWRHETGGTVVGGTPIKTDAASTGKITAAYVQAKADAGFTVNWKVATGFFATLDAATIIAIGDAVTAHVQACFDNEMALTTQIMMAADLSALMAIDLESGWPA